MKTALKQALKKLRTITAETESIRARKHEMQARKLVEARKISALQEEAVEGHGRAMVAGVTFDHAAVEAALAEARRHEAASGRAVVILDEQEAAALARLAEAKTTVTETALPFCSDKIDAAAAALRDGIAETIKATAPLMLGGEMLRRDLTGVNPTFSGDRFDPSRLWSPEVVVGRLLEAIPPRLRSPSIKFEALMAEGRRLADAGLKKLEEEE